MNCLANGVGLAPGRTAMSALFAKEVYIRLTDHQSMVCTVKYGRFYSKAAKFALRPQPGPALQEDAALVLARKRSARRSAPEQP